MMYKRCDLCSRESIDSIPVRNHEFIMSRWESFEEVFGSVYGQQPGLFSETSVLNCSLGNRV